MSIIDVINKHKKDLGYAALISTLALTLTLNVTFNTTVINNTYNQLKELQTQTAEIQKNNTITANQTLQHLDNITEQIENINQTIIFG